LINLSPSAPLDFDVLERVMKLKDVSKKCSTCRPFIHVSRDEMSKIKSKTKQCVFLG
jgi:hypothetical protein